MNKEKIDELINILKGEDSFNTIKSLCEFCDNEELKARILKIVNKLIEYFQIGDENLSPEDRKNLEELLLPELESNGQLLFQNIHSQVPEELLSYYYVEIYCNNLEDLVFNDEQKTISKAIFENWIEKIINGIDENEKISAIKKLLPKKEKDAVKILKTLESSKKIELLPLLKLDSNKVEVIKTLDESEKINSLSLIEYEGMRVEVILTLSDSKKEELLETLLDDYYKAKVIKTLSDTKKEELLTKVESIDSKTDIICTLSDTKKIKLLSILPEDIYKIKVIKTIKDDGIRKKAALEYLQSDFDKATIIATLNDSEKIDTLEKIDSKFNRTRVIASINNPKDKMKIALKYLAGDSNALEDVIKTIENPTERIQLAIQYLDIWSKERIIRELEDSAKVKELENFKGNDKILIAEMIQSPEIKIQILDRFEGQDWIKIASTLPDKEKLTILEDLDENVKFSLIRTIQNPEVMPKALNKLENKEHSQILKRLYETNNDVVKNIDLRILDKKYLDTLGEQKINLISCYAEVQQKILTLTDVQYGVFEKCLNNYLNNNKETEEWTVVASAILENLINGQYSELIHNIDNIQELDIEKLTKLLQFSNDLGLRTIEDIKNYEEIKRKKCDEIINGSTDIQEKKKALFLKIFGQDLQYTETIITKYGEDIKSLEDCDEKYYVMALQVIMNTTDEDILKQIYNECGEVELIDKTSIERGLKTAYGKMFNEGLYETKDENILEDEKVPEELKKMGVNVYNAGVDFKMIITSVAPFVRNNPEDFKKDWNRPAIASQHFCASYIRSDMLGRPPIPHLCYGFSKMKEDALMLSGSRDIFSSGAEFESFALHDEKYYSPDEQINKTTRNYNEMDFRRIQGEEKRQPDYIIAFKRNGKIGNIDKIIKAVQDWGGELPVVIIDVDECLKQQREQVDELLKQYNTDKSAEKAREILQKVRNNRMTDQDFCQDIQTQLTQIEKESGVKLETVTEPEQSPKSKVGIDELKGNSAIVTAEERKEGIGKMRQVFTKIQQIVEDKKEEEVQQ